jgi:hypothetical protein
MLKKITLIMLKKITLSLIAVTIIIITLYFAIIFLQSVFLTRSYSIENRVELNNENTKFIRCNRSILNPEFAYTFPFSDTIHISFFTTAKWLSLTEEEWDNSRTGGTTVKNTTFDELVKMVKEDCDQFKEGYLDYTGYEHLSDQEKDNLYYEIEQKNLGWTYTPVRTKEDITDEEIFEFEFTDEQRMKYLEDFAEKRKDFAPIEDYYK